MDRSGGFFSKKIAKREAENMRLDKFLADMGYGSRKESEASNQERRCCGQWSTSQK